MKKARTFLSQLQLDELIFEVNAREEPNKGSAMARFLGRGLRNKIPNSVDRTIDFKELIRKRREEREKRVTKKGRTEEKKLVFGINEKVRLQCPRTKLWNIRGKVHGIRFNEAGTIVSYEIMLRNGNVTTRHRRFMTKDLPEVESQPVIHDVEADIHGGSNVSTPGSSKHEVIHEESKITNSVNSEHGVITRSKKRMFAN